VTAFALASTQVSALAARRRERDPASVRRLFASSCALAVAVAAMYTALLWAQIDAGSYARLLASLGVLDLLAVALQPILARARPVSALHRLGIVVESGETVVMDVEAADLAAAAAKAIDRCTLVYAQPCGRVRMSYPGRTGCGCVDWATTLEARLERS
jgi:hypothetical protein